MKKELSYVQKALQKYAEEQQTTFIPMQEAFDEYAKKVPIRYLVWDSVHPTVTGHEIIAKHWLAVLDDEKLWR